MTSPQKPTPMREQQQFKSRKQKQKQTQMKQPSPNQTQTHSPSPSQREAQNRKRKSQLPESVEALQEHMKTSSNNNSSSSRQKRELEYLRTRVKELEQQLSELEAKRQRAQEEQETQNQHETIAIHAWKRCAMNQLAEKHQALKENQELKAALQEHIRLAKGLDRYVRMHPELLTGSAPDPATELLVLHDIEQPACWQRLDAAVDMLDTIFHATDLLQLGVEARRVSLADTTPFMKEENAFHMQVMQTRAFAFAMDDVCDAMWSSVEEMPWGEAVELTMKTWRDRIFVKYKFVFTIGSGVFDYDSTIVMKRYCDQPGHPIVWESLSKIERLSGAREKYEVVETGWSRLEPFQDVDGGGTLCRSIFQYIPTLSVALAQDTDRCEDCFARLQVTEETPQFGVWSEIIFSRYMKLMHDANALIKQNLMKKKRAGLLSSPHQSPL